MILDSTLDGFFLLFIFTGWSRESLGAAEALWRTDGSRCRYVICGVSSCHYKRERMQKVDFLSIKGADKAYCSVGYFSWM